MNVAEWILVAFLSIALLIFIILGITLLTKLIGLTREIREIVVKGEKIASDVEGITHNVKNMTNVSGLIKTVLDTFNIKVGKKK